MERLETKNLVLRKARESDLEAIYNNVWSDQEIAKTMLWEPTKTLEDAASRLERTIKYQSVYHAYFVCLKETNEPVGFAGVRKTDDGGYEESGICVARKYWGLGYGKEILGALLELSFCVLGAKRFVYGCFKDNVRSRKVALRFGFEYINSYEITREHDGVTFVVDSYELTKDKYCG